MKMFAAAFVALLLPAIGSAQTADVTGKWDMSFNTQQGAMQSVMNIQKDGDKLSGTITGPQGDLPIAVTLKEKAITIEAAITTPNGNINMVMTGTVDGDSMKGTVDFGGRSSADWSAKRTGPPPAQTKPAPDKPAQDQKSTMTGIWQFEVQHAAGTSTPMLNITQTGEKLSGKYAGSYGESDLVGSIKGTDFTFTVEINAQGTMIKATYVGTLDKDTVKGNVTFTEMGEGTFTGKRK
jgi:hypothetical protein